MARCAATHRHRRRRTIESIRRLMLSKNRSSLLKTARPFRGNPHRSGEGAAVFAEEESHEEKQQALKKELARHRNGAHHSRRRNDPCHERPYRDVSSGNSLGCSRRNGALCEDGPARLPTPDWRALTEALEPAATGALRIRRRITMALRRKAPGPAVPRREGRSGWFDEGPRQHAVAKCSPGLR